MHIIRTVKEMHAFSSSMLGTGKKLVLVPTMGFLHEGHLSLMRIGKEHGDVLVVSIFVNPAQFGPGEDFEQYPRDFERDMKLVASVGGDCIFAPDAHEMYPDGYQTTITVDRITRHLCGITRPHHFEGVTTVVAKLFNCTKPHAAVFGEKDFQQLMVIKRMVLDCNYDIEIIPGPIVREPDGLAMSSRNTYLTPEQRSSALSLSRALFTVKERFDAGERDAERLIAVARDMIFSEKHTRIDYIKICAVDTLEDVAAISGDAVMALAVYVGTTRLIDNIVLTAA
ncbi:MAG: pantoate--beta-alanine ligase [Chitinivibrionales bacterium]|nr:pantoate--beta-alanine ligase [Chitinivibrionales bacterium]